MNRKTALTDQGGIARNLMNALREHSALIVVLSSAFILLAVSTYFSFVEVNTFRKLNLVDFEIGRVADRDVVASREISYVDENSTRIRRDARQRLVTAVFRYDRNVSASVINEFTGFTEFVTAAMQSASGAEQFLLELQQAYPGLIEKKHLTALYSAPDRAGILAVSLNVMKQVVNQGITSFPDEGMEKFNQSDVEVVRWRNDRQERIVVPKDSLLTWDDLRGYISNALVLMRKNPAMTDTVLQLVKPFLKENLIYQSDESEGKLDAAVRQVAPVLVVIQKGQKIIKRGFIISEESYGQLEALANSGVYLDIRQFVGTVCCLAAVMLIALYVFSHGVWGKSLALRNQVMLVVIFVVEYVLALACSHVQAFSLPLDLAIVIPAALFTMLITALIDQRTGVLMSFILSLGILCATGFSIAPTLYTLLTGITGASVMRITGKRIDLVKSACILAAASPAILVIIRTVMPGTSRDAGFAILGAAVNGFMSGILVLGFLPILESALNTSTSFRLMEFSDLNSPIMKRMLLSVSGTYNHSIMVATLAESACREIGADPLLARVGAYYHDIGKMDQSDYFVENQTDYNRHLDLNPRLSATVIRSHVKQGVEKARQMRLPREVIDIISEHHGNSLISYFYSEAKKLDDAVDPEDFMYPGNPPRSRESAVVMLADVVEAACRTLEKPSVPRLEKFIGELIAKKIEAHQLDNSDLTFSEIETIKRNFVNILAGYYHSRIEYPNQKDPDAQVAPVKNSFIKGKKT